MVQFQSVVKHTYHANWSRLQANNRLDMRSLQLQVQLQKGLSGRAPAMPDDKT